MSRFLDGLRCALFRRSLNASPVRHAPAGVIAREDDVTRTVFTRFCWERDALQSEVRPDAPSGPGRLCVSSPGGPCPLIPGEARRSSGGHLAAAGGQNAGLQRQQGRYGGEGCPAASVTSTGLSGEPGGGLEREQAVSGVWTEPREEEVRHRRSRERDGGSPRGRAGEGPEEGVQTPGREDHLLPRREGSQGEGGVRRRSQLRTRGRGHLV